jgi:hypothetical protein
MMKINLTLKFNKRTKETKFIIMIATGYMTNGLRPSFSISGILISVANTLTKPVERMAY